MKAPKSGDASLNIGLIVLSVAAILLALRIPEVGAGSARDPGPRAFPIALSLFIITGAATQLIAGAVRQRRGLRKGASPGQAANCVDQSGPSSGANQDATIAAPQSVWKIALLMAALVAYLALMPWIGFTLATLPFALFLMRALGSSWKMSAAVSFGLLIAVLVLFQWAFRVQLPAGELGLRF